MKGVRGIQHVVVVNESHLLDREMLEEVSFLLNVALDEIHHFSGGAARLINKLCNHSLLYSSQNGRRIIDDHTIKQVIQGELS